MQTLTFNISPSTPATPFVSQTLRGGKTFVLTFPTGTTSAIFIQQSADGNNWQSKQSISPTNQATFNVSATDTTYLRLLVNSQPATAQYDDYDTPGGGSGTVKSVNGVQPDKDGNVTLTALPSAPYATDSDIDALWS